MADVRLANKHGDIPLHHAVAKDSFKICKMLVEVKQTQMVVIFEGTSSPLPLYIHLQIAEYLYEKYDLKMLEQMNLKLQWPYHVAREGKVKDYLYQIMSRSSSFFDIGKIHNSDGQIWERATATRRPYHP